MNLEVLQEFFFWCMVVNSGVYALTVVAVLLMRDFVCRVNSRLFGIDETATRATIQNYIGNFKLLITCFNFGPWLALLIISK